MRRNVIRARPRNGPPGEADDAALEAFFALNDD
jgi:hypothetical protein